MYICVDFCKLFVKVVVFLLSGWLIMMLNYYLKKT